MFTELDTNRIIDEQEEKESAIAIAERILNEDPYSPHPLARALLMKVVVGDPITPIMVKQFFQVESLSSQPDTLHSSIFNPDFGDY